MILDKKLTASLDQEKGLLIMLPESTEHAIAEDAIEAIDMMIEANERFTIPPSTWSMSGQLARNNGGVRSVGSYGDSPEQEACDHSFNIRIKSANSACMHHLSPSKVKTMHLYSLGRIVI